MRSLVVAPLFVAGAAVAGPVRAPFHVTYDADHLDLDGRVLQFQMSRPAGSAELTAIGEDGQPLGTGSASYDHPPPGTWQSVSWTQPADARVLKLQLRTVSADGQHARRDRRAPQPPRRLRDRAARRVAAVQGPVPQGPRVVEAAAVACG